METSCIRSILGRKKKKKKKKTCTFPSGGEAGRVPTGSSRLVDDSIASRQIYSPECMPRAKVSSSLQSRLETHLGGFNSTAYHGMGLIDPKSKYSRRLDGRRGY